MERTSAIYRRIIEVKNVEVEREVISTVCNLEWVECDITMNTSYHRSRCSEIWKNCDWFSNITVLVGVLTRQCTCGE